MTADEYVDFVNDLEICIKTNDFDLIYNNCFSNIPDNYSVMFMQGGGTGLFCAVAMNLMSRTGKADYIVTGTVNVGRRRMG